jgi:hemerythrin superfamily protein
MLKRKYYEDKVCVFIKVLVDHYGADNSKLFVNLKGSEACQRLAS